MANVAVTYFNKRQHSVLLATGLERTQNPLGLTTWPLSTWGVHWRRAWAGALALELVLARAQSLPLWNGSENLEMGQQYQGHTKEY